MDEPPGMDEPEALAAGMTVSVRSRHDVVVVDPDRFLAAARQAFRELNPEVTEDEAARTIVDLYDAAHALLERHGRLGPIQPAPSVGSGARSPGERVLDAPDGLSPAGEIFQVVLNEAMPLQDHGCFLPEDPFALPRKQSGS
ncbi:hypothetical protein [Actinomadura sp. 9N407]|uniref:hypothetical protein n=1 Tax=Actinomadura sp. 9N407 TaxID=3375154 RepID=UPI0037877335